MLFTAPEFIFLFLPITLLLFVVAVRFGFIRGAIVMLAVASLFFYAWWKIEYLALLLGSILFNYFWGKKIDGYLKKGSSKSKSIMLTGVAVNLLALGYFKYANFFVDSLNTITGTGLHLEKIVLPLAISFFTFQQIAYLVDVYKGIVKHDDFATYCLFVTFFPQLIAGPIVHHKDMMPQFTTLHPYSVSVSNLALGSTLFFMGLFKKLVLADTMAGYANPIFYAADAGAMIQPAEAWFGALTYTFQLYFDFSGYSDMAIGGAKMFGINIIVNFNSPYKSRSIVEFWRRWHISLSNFLRDYLYISLGGNRCGNVRRYFNLFATMLLGGLWHGAGWNFILWGGLHGLYLSVNHFWSSLLKKIPSLQIINKFSPIYYVLTFVSVVVAWVLFRAETFAGAGIILSAMFLDGGWALPHLQVLVPAENDSFIEIVYMPFLTSSRALYELGFVAFAAFFLPNSQQIIGKISPRIERSNKQAYFLFGFMLYLIVMMAWINMGKEINEFIYFNF